MTGVETAGKGLAWLLLGDGEMDSFEIINSYFFVNCNHLDMCTPRPSALDSQLDFLEKKGQNLRLLREKADELGQSDCSGV